MDDRCGDRCASAGEREEVLGKWISVETSWNRQATGMSPAGPPSPRTGQEPHVSESPGDIIKDAGEQAPPRNLNVGSRGVTELPPSERVTPRDSEARSGLKGPGLGFRVSERSKALPRRSGLSSTRGRWEGERTGAQAHGGGCSEKAVYCLLILYRGTERSYKYSIGCHWQCYF